MTDRRSKDSQKQWFDKTNGSNIERKLGYILYSELLIHHFKVIWESLSIPDQVQLVCHLLTKEMMYLLKSWSQELKLYHTWILEWKVNYHNKSAFRLVSAKQNDKIFMKQEALYWGTFRLSTIKNEFSERIRTCQFLDDIIM